MDQNLAQDVPENRRREYLKDSCEKVEKIGYLKKYTFDQLTMKKSDLAEKSIELNGIDHERKEAMDSFKERQKPLREEISSLLTNIRLRGEEVDQECYLFFDEPTKTAGYYNDSGELIYTRPMRPEEFQKSIFSLEKTGTNN